MNKNLLKNTLVCSLLLATGVSTATAARSLSSFTDIYDPNLPGSAYGWVVRADHLLVSQGVVDFDLMEAIDWIVPNSIAAFGPGVFDRMDAPVARITALEPTGFSNSGAHHQWDSHIVPIVYSNGALTGASDPNGFWATNWLGDDPGGNATWQFRVEVGADSLEVWHWWNHGLGNVQTVQATLFNAAGQPQLNETVYAHNSTIHRQFTTILNVSGAEEGDYLIIEHKGTNVGWRGSAVIGLDSGPVIPDVNPFEEFELVDGYADTGDWLGYVYVEGTFPYVYIHSLNSWAFSAAGWFYIFNDLGDSVTALQDGVDIWVYIAPVASFARRQGSWYNVLRR
ncbi:MAG: hypothetical protein LR015_01425 [Verrucomicrobia bacterium]|nr:hypothetical protein [Verrucomicrobiota bacterium]